MRKYRLLLVSMLLFAFLGVGEAQQHGEMPAELEVSLDRAAMQGRRYHIGGTILLQIPDNDNTFVVKTRMQAYWRMSPLYRKCRLKAALITLQVVGRRNHDRLKLALSLTPEVLRPVCGDNRLMKTSYRVMVNTGDLNAREFMLFVAEGSSDERRIQDSTHLGKLTQRLTLHLACPGRLDIVEAAPLIFVLPTDPVPWPLVSDDSKTSGELSTIAAKDSNVVGLTRPAKPYPPIAFFRSASRRAALGPGFCFWINSIQVEFTPVQIMLASKYAASSCEYTAIREHEMMHYRDMQLLFVNYQAHIRTALRQAGFPTVERPIFVESVRQGTSQNEARLQSTLQPIYGLMTADLREDAEARDSPEQRALSWSKCPNWDSRSTGPQPPASLASDLDKRVMQLGTKQMLSEFLGKREK